MLNIPVTGTAQSTLRLSPWQTCLGKLNSGKLQLRDNCLYTNTHHCL